MRRPTVFQINAVVLAVGLTGSYVWFRAVQAQQQHEDRILPSSKLGRVRVDRPASATTSASPTTSKALFYGSKSAPVDLSTLQISRSSTEPAVILTNPTATTAPATQPAP